MGDCGWFTQWVMGDSPSGWWVIWVIHPGWWVGYGWWHLFAPWDRHILKNDLKKWGAGDPLNFSNFFAKIVFLMLLYKTVTKFLCKSTNFGYFWPLQNRYFSTKTVKNSSKIEISQKAITRTKKYICTNILHIILDIFVKKFRQKNLF